MQCDKCHKHIGEDDTYEYILCGICEKNEEFPDVYCAKCGVIVKWVDSLDKIKNIWEKIRVLRYPIWISFFLFIIALEWRNILFNHILIGAAVIIVCLIAIVGAGIIVFPGMYVLGHGAGKKLKWHMPNSSPNGVFTWLFGVAIASLPVIIYFLGQLLALIGRKVLGQ